jgi:hypothetical protein
MSAAASQAAAFYREVAKMRVVWTIKDAGGFPAPQTSEGRAQPFWSSRGERERMDEWSTALTFGPVREALARARAALPPSAERCRHTPAHILSRSEGASA